MTMNYPREVIEAAYGRTDLKPSMFGVRAMGDPNLMRQLRPPGPLTDAQADRPGYGSPGRNL